MKYLKCFFKNVTKKHEKIYKCLRSQHDLEGILNLAGKVFLFPIKGTLFKKEKKKIRKISGIVSALSCILS